MLKKLFFSLTLLGYSYVSQAQQVVSSPQPNPEDVGDVVAELATSLSTLDGSRITTGVLVNRTVPLSDPHPFNGTASSPNNTYSEWQQQYWQFYQASLSTSALPTPADLYDRVQAKIETGQTPLVVLQYRYQELRPDAATLGLIRIDSLNERVYDGPDRSQSPYTERQFFSVAIPALGMRADGSATLYVGPEFWVGNTPAPAGLSLDLGDGLGLRYVPMGSTIQIPAGSGLSARGTAGVNARIVKIAIGTYSAFAKAHKPKKVAEGPDQALGIYAARQWSSAPSRASAIAWVKWGRGNTSGKFHKPLVFVEGIDFEDRNGNPDRKDDRKHNYFVKHPPTAIGIAPISLSDPQFEEGYRNGEAGWDEMVQYNDDYKSLEKLPSLRQEIQNPSADPSKEGYDVIYLDFTDGADFIENNAMTLVDLLTYINNNREGRTETVVMGASMGGQVARFALAWMEQQENMCHGTKLYVSFDSPHRGANISLGMQHMIQRLAQIRTLGRGSFLDKRGLLNRPASRQMIVYHYDPAAAPLRNAWQAWQNSPGGYPTYLRKVAVTNGDGRGNSITGSWPGMELLRTSQYGAPWPWGDNVVYALPGGSSRGNNNVIFRYKHWYGTQWHYIKVASTSPAYDTAPGGTRQTADQFNDANSLTPMMFKKGAIDFDTFIPAVSALGITEAAAGTVANANVNYNTGLIDPGRPDPSKYAFDAYFAPTENEPHVQITNGQTSPQGNPFYASNNSTWIRRELEESEHALPLDLTYQYNYGSLFRRLLPSVNIRNGGTLLVNAAGIPVSGGTPATQINPTETAFDLYTSSCGSRVSVLDGGVFRIGNTSGQQNATVRFVKNGLLDVQAGSQVTVHPGSVLRIQRGATLVVRRGGVLQNSGQIIVESGAFVCIENMADVQGQKPVFQPDVTFAANPALNLGPLACTIDCSNTVFSIVGNPVICNSSDYRIEGLPAGAAVTWKIDASAGSVLKLDQNVPSANQLRITNQKWYTVTTTLTATISAPACGPGEIVLTKTIANNNSTNFYYVQEACTFYGVNHPSQTGYASPSNATFVHQGCMVRVNLGSNSTVTLGSGGTPAVWGTTPGQLYFQLPYGSGGVPFTFNVDTKSDCGVHQLVFFPYSNNARYAYTASPNPATEEVMVTAMEEEGSDKKSKQKDAGPLSYTVEVYEITTGQLKLTQKNENGNLKTKLKTNKLAPGHYILHIMDGESSQTIRIQKQ